MLGGSVSEPSPQDQATNQPKAELLNQLKIDRDAPSDGGGNGVKWGLALAAVLLVAAGWFFVDFPSKAEAVTVRTTIALGASAGPVAGSVLDATGYVVARRQATVSSKATGKVLEVMIEEGVTVQEGELLARLDDSIPRAQYELAQSQLEASRASLAELEVSLKQAQLDLQRTRNLAERELASKADLDRDTLGVEGLSARLARAEKDILVAERAMAVQGQLLQDMQIRAPFSGIVVAKAAQPGEMISPVSAGGGFTRTGICTIVDMASLEIEVDVNESYINRVYAGQPVQATLNAYPEFNYPAQVIAIIPTADRNKATVRVRVGFLERDDKVLPDMGVRVAFLDDTQTTATTQVPEGVLVPADSVAEAGGSYFLYVIKDNVAQRRTVRLGGAETNDRVRILTGLDHGERIVASLADGVAEQLDNGVLVEAVR